MNGTQPRTPEDIYILPPEMAELPVEGQVTHGFRMVQSYLQRLFQHVYIVEHQLSNPETGLISKVQSLSEYQEELRKRDAIEKVGWAGRRMKLEGKVAAGIIIAVVVNGAGLIIVALRLFGGS